MGVIDFAQYLNSAIAAGQAVEGSVVRVIADNGTEIGNAVFQVIDGGNGVSQEVGIATAAAAGGGSVTTGMAFMAVDLGVLGMAIAPALGIEAGISIYELVSGDTGFRDRLRQSLYEDAKTIGGKAIAYWNGENFYADESVIEIYKNLLVEYGVFQADRAVQSNEFQQTDPGLTNNFRITTATDQLPFLGDDGEIHYYSFQEGNNFQSLCAFPSNDILPLNPNYI